MKKLLSKIITILFVFILIFINPLLAYGNNSDEQDKITKLKKENELKKEEILDTELVVEEIINGNWEGKTSRLIKIGYDHKELKIVIEKRLQEIEEEEEQRLLEQQLYELALYEQQQQVYYQATYTIPQPQPQPVPSSLGASVVGAAWNYVGWLPYVWGGADLNSGTDCCGFTMCIYALFGVNIGRTVEAQACQGYSVPLSSAAPGDLVIYGGHVAIYIGDGQVIHCPTPGQCVSVASVYMMPVWDVRHIG